MAIPTGAIRYNTDSNKMECFNGTKWMQVAVSSPDSGPYGWTIGVFGGGDRGVFAGRGVPANSDTMDYITISIAANAIDFGDLTHVGAYRRGCSSSTRGIFAQSGVPSGDENIIEYITMASTGNAIDFGDHIASSCFANGCGSNETRAVFWEGTSPSTNVISYVTIATTGNAKDFGDAAENTRHTDACGSPTRSFIAGGYLANPGGNTDMIQQLNITSKGNAVDFGNCIAGIRGNAACSNSIRACWAAGINSSGSVVSDIETITMSTTGSSVLFGDLTYSNRVEGGGTSSATRGIFAGGYTPSNVNNIESIEFASGGRAIDFGDRTETGICGACSSGHGGL